MVHSDVRLGTTLMILGNELEEWQTRAQLCREQGQAEEAARFEYRAQQLQQAHDRLAMHALVEGIDPVWLGSTKVSA